MRIEDHKTLRRFQLSGRCEGCGRWCQERDAHHTIFKRGIGSANRLDVAENLMGLGRFCCHVRAEDEREFNRGLQEKLIARLRREIGKPLTLDEVTGWLRAVLNSDKAGPMPPKPWSDEP